MMNLLFVMLAAIPTIESPITDLSGHLSLGAIEAMGTDLRALHATTGVQMAVLVVNSTAPMGIDEYAQSVFDQWGGGSSERDDGVLLVLAINDRRNRLHLGYGIEPFLPDAAARTLLDRQILHLRAKAYDRAIQSIIAGVAERVASIEPGVPIEMPLGMHHPGAFVLVVLIGLIAGFLWGIQAVPRIRRTFEDDAPPPHTPPHRGWALALWVGAPIAIALLFSAGKGFWFAYPLVWLLGALVGYAAVYTARQFSEAAAFTWGFLSPAATAAVLLNTSIPTSGGGVVNLVVYLALALLAAFAVSLLFFALTTAQGPQGGWDGSSSGGTARGSNSSSWGTSNSTVWGSASSSSGGWGTSSGSSSSSSSSSGGWSGGGGSSGGGGASSGW